MDDGGLLPKSSSIAGRKPDKIISVPPELRREAYKREIDTLVNEVQTKTNCTVVAQWDHSSVKRFDFYGAGNSLERAIAMVNKWMTNAPEKSVKASSWAKLSAHDHNTWYSDAIKTMEEERKKKYLEPKPELQEDGTPFCSITLTWPEDLGDSDVDPRAAFGNKLEGLNDIRKQAEAWIILLPRNDGPWQIEISGREDNNVEQARTRYETMIDQVRLKTMGVQGALNIMMDQNEGIEVALERPPAWWPIHAEQIVPRLLHSAMMFERGTFRKDGLEDDQLLLVQQSMIHGLEQARHKRGSYDFAVRLGYVALDSSKIPEHQIGKTFGKPEFLRAIDSRVNMVVRKWAMNHEIGWEVHKRLCTLDGFLEPTKSTSFFGLVPESLEQTRPIYRGTWVFRDPSVIVAAPAPLKRHMGRPAMHAVPSPAVPLPSSSLYVVQIDWTDDEDGGYEKASTRFFKIHPSKTGPSVNMEINLLELGESRAWHFGLESLIPISRELVSPVITGFASRAKIIRNYDHQSEKCFAEWNITPTVRQHLVTGRLDKIYSFGIKNTGFKVELTAMWYPQHKSPVWGVSVRHIEWATHLAQLETLSAGDKADWGDTLTAFLPNDIFDHREEGDLGMEYMSLEAEEEGKAPRESMRALVKSMLLLSDIVSAVAADAEGGIRI